MLKDDRNSWAPPAVPELATTVARHHGTTVDDSVRYNRRRGPVAPTVEQRTFNPKRVGSSPTGPTAGCFVKVHGIVREVGLSVTELRHGVLR
jgi:hypothetical protein